MATIPYVNTADSQQKVTPARLSFLTIYSPPLGTTDETFRDQIVFYRSRKRKSIQDEDQRAQDQQEEENERLRQLGLAQGMLNFAKDFSNGSKLDTIDTEKSRIVTHELERNWWVLASIDLTRIPISGKSKTETSTDSPDDKLEYSSRDISPPVLLIQQLIRAHAVFKLHHGSSLSNLYSRHPRVKFCAMLERFWTRFAASWDVMLHGIPAADVFGGMQLAAGGELGMGVGEEEWGAGEREVLEDFARRTDGLVDILVSRFHDPSEAQEAKKEEGKMKSTTSKADDVEPWMGYGRDVLAQDGVVFSGVGTVSRGSMRDISYWVQSIYTHGESAYGVKDSPSSDRRKGRKRQPRASKHSSQDLGPRPGIPRSIVASAEKSLDAALTKAEGRQPATQSKASRAKSPDPSATKGQETWKKYLMLGYGTAWGVSDSAPSDLQADTMRERLKAHIAKENTGHFLIGLHGDPDDDVDEASSASENEVAEWNRRIMLRTLNVTMQDSTRGGLNTSSVSEYGSSISSQAKASKEKKSPELSRSGDDDSNETVKPAQTRMTKRARVLVYVHRPFIYTMLFDPLTANLMMPSFYRDLHTFLFPLHPLLVRRTGAAVATERKIQTINHHISSISTHSPSRSASPSNQSWEIVHDSETFTTCANIPSINDEAMSRAETLNMHSAALELLQSVQPNEEERRIRTARGWWIGWARAATAEEEVGEGAGESVVLRQGRDAARAETKSVLNKRHGREILLFRRARDAETKGKSRAVSGWSLRGGEGSRLEDMGLGFDTRKYMEGIMSFGRT